MPCTLRAAPSRRPGIVGEFLPLPDPYVWGVRMMVMMMMKTMTMTTTTMMTTP